MLGALLLHAFLDANAGHWRHFGDLGGDILIVWDAIFILLTLALVALSVAYTRGCDKV